MEDNNINETINNKNEAQEAVAQPIQSAPKAEGKAKASFILGIIGTATGTLALGAVVLGLFISGSHEVARGYADLGQGQTIVASESRGSMGQGGMREDRGTSTDHSSDTCTDEDCAGE